MVLVTEKSDRVIKLMTEVLRWFTSIFNDLYRLQVEKLLHSSSFRLIHFGLMF
jgi:hypothetical protein